MSAHPWYFPAGSLAGARTSVELDPTRAGWSYCGLTVRTLDDGVTFTTGGREVAVVPLSGPVSIDVDGRRFELTGRESVFAAVTDWAYLPIDAEVRLTGPATSEVALASATATRRHEPVHVPAADVPVEIRGAGPATRQVTNFMAPDVFGGADKLMCVELLTPGGNWSSYPPHRHDDSPECPVNNEEIYYFRVGRDGGVDYAADGFGLHRTYTPDGDARRPGRGPRRRRVLRPPRLPRAVRRGTRLPDVLPQRPRRTWRRAVDGVLRRSHPPLGAGDVGGHADRSALPDDERSGAGDVTRRPLGIGVIGFGWMGQAHSRSYRRIPTLFPDRNADPELVVCADAVEARRVQAVEGFGFASATDDWRKVVEHPDVDVVVVTAPNMLHVEISSAAAANGKAVFCEKPVGGTPAQTVAAERAARGVITGVGYNYRWAPLVQEAKALIDDGRLGTDHQLPRPLPLVYGNDPLGVLSWRFLVDAAGYGVSTDLLSHAVDLAMHLIGPITEVVGVGETFIRERPLPGVEGTHYDRGRLGDPTGMVTNEDWFGAIVRFASGAMGTFESSPVDGRAGEPARLRGLRHQGRAARGTSSG